jgi:hypothetical protein
MSYETCPACGSVLLWINRQLGCPRRHEDLAAGLLSRGTEGAKPAARHGGSAAAGHNAQLDASHNTGASQWP